MGEVKMAKKSNDGTIEVGEMEFTPTESSYSGLISCLRNDKVIVRYINKSNNAITNPRHVLYGGMAETATRVFTVPMLRSGGLVNVLTDEEKAFLEDYMGLSKNALSVHAKGDNY
jgi:hypothetical protein